MIDLDSLKEQLQLMGHNLPDDQILTILKDMNIEVAATGTELSEPIGVTQQPSAPLSALSNVPSASSSYAYMWAPFPPGPPPAANIAPAASQLEIDSVRMGLTGELFDLDFMQACSGPVGQQKQQQQASTISNTTAWPQVSTYTAITATQPAPIAKQPHEWYGPQFSASISNAQPQTTSHSTTTVGVSTGQPFTFGANTPAGQTNNLLGSTHANSHQPNLDAYAGNSRSQQQNVYEDEAHHEDDHDSDHDDLYEKDNRVNDILARYYKGEKNASTAAMSGYTADPAFLQDVGYTHDQDRDQQPRTTAGPLPNEYVHQPSLLRRVTDDVVRPSVHHTHRPAKYQWQDALRSDEPVSVAQQPNSSSNSNSRRQPSNNGGSSIAGGSRSSCGGGSAAGYSSTTSRALNTSNTTKQRKGDVVSRYAQLQDSWSRDRFLSSSGGSSAGRSTVAGSRKVAVATTRKPLNFHTYFKVLHAAEEAKKDMRVKMSREYTAATLSSSSQPRR